MKKRLICGAILILLVGLGIFFWPKYQTEKPIPTLRLVPADAIVLATLPDLEASAKKWPATAVAQILAEPSVRTFLSHPLSVTPEAYKNLWTTFTRLGARSTFFCSTNIKHRDWMFGVECSSDLHGWRHDVGMLVTRSFGAHLVEVSPGQEVKEKKTEDGDPIVYAMQIESWLLFSRDPGKLSMAFAQSRQPKAGLEVSADFQKCAEKVPINPDILSYIQHEAFAQLGLPRGQFEGDEAMIAATSLDGSLIRDTVFTYQTGTASEIPLDRKSLSLGGPQTMFYGAFRLNLMGLKSFAHTFSGRWGFAGTLQDYINELIKAGIDFQELSRLLSNAEIIVNDDPSNKSLGAVITASVNDERRLDQLTNRLMQQKFPAKWTRSRIEGVPVNILRAGKSSSAATLVVGIYDQQLYLASSTDGFGDAIRQSKIHQVSLEQNKQYQSTVGMVSTPTDLFAYLDTRTAFARLYSAIRPMAVLGTTFVPSLGDYCDPNALPEAEAISKHLTPIVLSRYKVKDGVIDESVGPITAYQASIIIAGIGVAFGLLGNE